MRGLVVVAVVVGLAPAYGEPVKPVRPSREWKAKRIAPTRAHQAGHYDAAVRNFTAAMSNNPKPELVYHAAQAYRLKGERGKAVELYQQYLDVAPRGAAANACHAELEKLRDVP